MLLYTVRCLLSIFAQQMIFFDKKYFVFVDETATPTQILHTAYSEKPVRETWRTPFIHYSPTLVFVVWPLFRCCSRIVYSRLARIVYSGPVRIVYSGPARIVYSGLARIVHSELAYAAESHHCLVFLHQNPKFDLE